MVPPMNDLATEVDKLNTTQTSVIERVKVDYDTLEEQVRKAHEHIGHNDNIIENAQRAISQARQNNREQKDFIRITKRRQRVMARTTFDLEQINRGL